MTDPAWFLGLTKHVWNVIGTCALCIPLIPIAFGFLLAQAILWREIYRWASGHADSVVMYLWRGK